MKKRDFLSLWGPDFLFGNKNFTKLTVEDMVSKKCENAPQTTPGKKVILEGILQDFLDVPGFHHGSDGLEDA